MLLIEFWDIKIYPWFTHTKSIECGDICYWLSLHVTYQCFSLLSVLVQCLMAADGHCEGFWPERAAVCSVQDTSAQQRLEGRQKSQLYQVCNTDVHRFCCLFYIVVKLYVEVGNCLLVYCIIISWLVVEFTVATLFDCMLTACVVVAVVVDTLCVSTTFTNNLIIRTSSDSTTSLRSTTTRQSHSVVSLLLFLCQLDAAVCADCVDYNSSFVPAQCWHGRPWPQ